jgi:isoleucyl-tRNA synthetase
MDYIKNENEIMKFWETNNIFKKSLKQNINFKEFIHIQGPPFATGKMHYGHYLTETIKDIICRYKTMKKYYVERTANWDTHGLPIEYEIEKELGIKTKEEILEYGIENYNNKCSNIVMRCIDDWKLGLTRLGRWLDFDNQCKTMDLNYMESLFWIFKQLFDKDLIYKGFKVMPYSNACSTPLSNFEAKSCYKEVTEESIIVSFKLLEKYENTFILVWTTTPWTLPSNLALCINKNIEYIYIYHIEHKKYYILASKLINKIFKNNTYEARGLINSEYLINIKYEPIFDYYSNIHNAFYIVSDDYVLDDSGTGIVHLSPTFGEDDYRICLNANLISKNGENLICPINDNGYFNSDIYDFEGKYIKDCDKLIINKLKNEQKLIKRINITHQYPYCWRSDTPLIYKAVSCWFINVEKIKENLIKNNNLTNWIPDHVKSKRFSNWLEDAKDWCVSRNRYWGTPIPIWISDDNEEIICIGSIEELETLANLKKGSITDLHRHNIDKIEIPSKKGKGMLKRHTSGILDCWFESGSILYAKNHYPFNNKLQNFSIDFIAEGLDQTRGWFYTLMIISTALFNKPAFNNVIVNGLVLAEDGKKMSKRLKNYTDPIENINKYGIDALRMYLIDSPVVKAESLKFNNDGLLNIIKTIILPLYNSYKFFNEHYTNFINNGNILNLNETINNSLDKWIQNKTNHFINSIDNDLNEFKLYNIVYKLKFFINQLNNEYIKLNRNYIKGKIGNWNNSLSTLAYVLYNISIILAPIAPYLAEYLYSNIKKIININIESVHLLYFDNIFLFNNYNENNIKSVDVLMNIINNIRQLRAEYNINLKMPLQEILIGTEFISEEFINYIKYEVNIINFKLINPINYINIKFSPINKTVGKTFRKNSKIISNFISNMNQIDINFFNINKYIIFKYNNIDFTILPEHIEQNNIILNIPNYKHIYNNNLIIFANILPNQNTNDLYFCRLLTHNIQQLRKNAKLSPWNKIFIYYKSDNKDIDNIINLYYNYIYDIIEYPIYKLINNDYKLNNNFYNIQCYVIISKIININNHNITITIINQ